MSDVRPVLDQVWREHAPGVLAVLARRLGDLDRAEEALQDAVAEALRRWPADGIPDNPPGWLVTTAWRKALDRLRREELGRRKEELVRSDELGGPRRDRLARPRRPEFGHSRRDEFGHAELSEISPAAPTADDRLTLLFACCHPSLSEAAQMALTLNAVVGLRVDAIAAAFLLPAATMAQRLVRAKRRLREQNVRFELPSPEEYPQRLTAVLAVIYLIYNEGHLSSTELTAEALELARRLTTLMPTEPEPAGLVALLELHESRAAARKDENGNLILLEDQDRRAWDRRLIKAAINRLARAAALDRPGPYQLEAAIAALHALAPSYQDTDWESVRRRYDDLLVLRPSPVVVLGRAVATSYTDGPEVALAEVDTLTDQLSGYRLWHATRADLLRRLNRPTEAIEATRRALALATHPAERELLTRRLKAANAP